MPLSDHLPAAGPAPAAHESTALRRLLVAVDGSDTAGAAASFAIWLAGTAGADVTLLHACPDLRSAEHAPPMADAAAFRAAAEHRLAETTKWQRRLQNIQDYAVAGAQVQSRVVRGSAASAVLDAAEELGSDVILLGSRGLGSMRRRLLGSVSSQVVDHAHCSVMVFPEGQECSPAHTASVIVGVDGSRGSEVAVAAGVTLASALDARLVLLAAFETTTPTDLRAELRRDAERVIAAARASVPAEIEVVEALREGPPHKMLLAASERFGSSVLAVGTRGLEGFRGLLLGSTSRWILHHASCPVLVARPRS